MSNPRAKAEQSRHKTIRQGGIDQRERLRGVSKKRRPVVVEYRHTDDWPFAKTMPFQRQKEWRKYGAYRNTQEAEKAMRDFKRKEARYYEFRLSPSG